MSLPYCCLTTARLLASLHQLAGGYPASGGDDITMISRTKFGVVLQQVDSASFSGQTLCVLLGNSFSFQGIQRANIALETNSEATASITLPGMLLSGTDLNRNTTIVYFIYLSDGLFLMRTSYAERPYTRVGSILLGANVRNTLQSDFEQPLQLKFLKNPVSMKSHIIAYQ